MTNDNAIPRGTLIAIGGAEDKSAESAIMQRIFRHAPAGNAKTGVITTASSIPDEIFPTYRDLFTTLSESEVVHLDVRKREQARDPAMIEFARSCGVLFITGGDQLRLTHVLGGSPLLAAIRERRMEGAVVAGTSAGAAAMSATMIYNGAAADALKKGAVNMSAGLGFVDDVVIDSHFLERGRFTRLMEVGATNPEYTGVGIGEDAAVMFLSGPSGPVLEAIGPGHVIIVDSSDLRSSNVTELSSGEPLALEHIVMHALTNGHGFDVGNRRFLHPEDVDRVRKDANLASS